MSQVFYQICPTGDFDECQAGLPYLNGDPRPWLTFVHANTGNEHHKVR